MIRLGLIGLGRIFDFQQQALALIPEEYNVVAVCDRDPEKAITYKKATNSNAKLVFSVEQMLCEDEVKTIVIDTPTASHYDIAKACLQAGKNVILEKPATLELDKLAELFDVAESSQVTLYVAFHSAFGPELVWFAQHRKEIEEQFGLGDWSSIRCCCYDPYMRGGKIIDGRQELCGSYIANGVNEISVCDVLVNWEEFAITEKHLYVAYDSKTVINSKHIFVSGDKKIVLETDWIRGINKKQTEIFYADGKKVLLDHSNQSVVVFVGDKQEQLYIDAEHERLVEQYIRVFNDFYHHGDNKISNREHAIRIHKKLFEGLQ